MQNDQYSKYHTKNTKMSQLREDINEKKRFLSGIAENVFFSLIHRQELTLCVRDVAKKKLGKCGNFSQVGNKFSVKVGNLAQPA